MSDGGPAFPTGEAFDPQGCVDGGQVMQYKVQGMSLRQAYAIAALQGMLAYSYCNPANGNYHENSTPEFVAKAAFQYADAMLKAGNTK